MAFLHGYRVKCRQLLRPPAAQRRSRPAHADNALGSAPLNSANLGAIQPSPFILRRDSERRAWDRVATWRRFSDSGCGPRLPGLYPLWIRSLSTTPSQKEGETWDMDWRWQPWLRLISVRSRFVEPGTATLQGVTPK